MNLLKACFIRVEVKKREFVSRLDLAIEMVRKGVPVIIGECYDSKELLKLGIDKGYFFGKCAQPYTLNIFKPLLDNGWSFGALDEEGLLPDNLEIFATGRFSSKSADIYKDIFFFGHKQKETFEKTFGFRDSFIVSGNPRVDMWKSKCYNLFNQLEQDIKYKYGDFVLLPLNFTYYTNNSVKTLSQHKNLQSSYKVLAEKSEFIFDSFCKLAERFAHEEKVKVIIRPHPADNLQSVKKLMVKHGVKSNLVECVATNDVFPWISSAKILFHNCCTTSVEAGFIGTPVVSFAPSKISLLQDDEVNNLFPIVENYEEAKVFLNQTNNDFTSDFKNKVARWRSLNIQNSNTAASFIADKIIERNNFKPLQNFQISNNIIDLKRIKYEFKAKIASMIGRHQNNVYLDKFPRTNIEEVENIVHHICKYRGYKKFIKIKSVNSRLFSITT